MKPVLIHPAGVRRLRRGHPWIYRTDVALLPPGARGGDLVTLAGADGRPQAVAAFSDTSQIALRVLPLNPDEDLEAGFLRLLTESIARRAARPAACRLVNADADGLPGLVVDRYGDALSLQAQTQAAARRQAAITAHLREVTGARLVVGRNDSRVREYEGLPQEKGVLDGDGPTEVEVEIGGLRLFFDLLEGQKTGGFLDQTDNRLAAAARGRGDALDLFCYDGGFSLHLARAGCRVTAVDSSGPALERLQRNAAHNGLTVETQEANVFDVLREWERAGRRFDTIVLDPPAFSKTRASIEPGRRAYKEVNLRALKLLRPGGLLVTCSCSAHMDRAEFETVVGEAAADARRFVRVLERRSAAVDHPSLLTAPETDYLKALFLEVG